MLDNTQQREIVKSLQDISELRGVAVLYYSLNACYSLSDGNKESENFGKHLVLIEEIRKGGRGIVDPQTIFKGSSREIPMTPELTTSANYVSNKSKLWAELAGSGLSCGAAAISLVGVLGAAAAEVPSGGTSTFVLVVSWGGLITSGAQCINGLARVSAIAVDYEGNSLQKWDENKIYATAMLAIDSIGVVLAVASLPASFKNIYTILKRSSSLPALDDFIKLTKKEQVQLMKKAIKAAAKNPESSKELAKALSVYKGANIKDKQAMALRAMEVLKKVTQHRLLRAGLETYGGLSGPVVSGLPSDKFGNASGVVNWSINKAFPEPQSDYIIHIVDLS